MCILNSITIESMFSKNLLYLLMDKKCLIFFFLDIASWFLNSPFGSYSSKNN